MADNSDLELQNELPPLDNEETASEIATSSKVASSSVAPLAKSASTSYKLAEKPIKITRPPLAKQPVAVGVKTGATVSKSTTTAPISRASPNAPISRANIKAKVSREESEEEEEQHPRVTSRRVVSREEPEEEQHPRVTSRRVVSREESEESEEEPTVVRRTGKNIIRPQSNRSTPTYGRGASRASPAPRSRGRQQKNKESGTFYDQAMRLKATDLSAIYTELRRAPPLIDSIPQGMGKTKQNYYDAIITSGEGCEMLKEAIRDKLGENVIEEGLCEPSEEQPTQVKRRTPVVKREEQPRRYSRRPTSREEVEEEEQPRRVSSRRVISREEKQEELHSLIDQLYAIDKNIYQDLKKAVKKVLAGAKPEEERTQEEQELLREDEELLREEEELLREDEELQQEGAEEEEEGAEED